MRLNQVGLFADGTAVKFVGEETFRLCKEYLDDVILVDTDAICAAIRTSSRTPSILEPSGRWPSPAPRNTPASTSSGQEPGRHHLRRQHEFRPPAFSFRARRIRRAARGRLRRHAAEKPGAYKKFLALIGNRNVTEFNYRYPHRQRGARYVGVQVADRKGNRSEAGRQPAESTATRRST